MIQQGQVFPGSVTQSRFGSSPPSSGWATGRRRRWGYRGAGANRDLERQLGQAAAAAVAAVAG